MMLWSRGFTLLEMLVVLVITALISTLLLQGLSYVLYLRAQFLRQLDNLQENELRQHWFRSSTAAILTDYLEGAHIFQGQPRKFSGLTLAALDNRFGIPTALSWRIHYQHGSTQLRYHNHQQQDWLISQWPGDYGSFRYQDTKGQWHTQWPPQLGSEYPQLPQAILLLGQQGQTPVMWLVKLSEYNRSRIDHRLEQFF